MARVLSPNWDRPSVARKTVWGLTDQVVVSLGNFLTNLLLLRLFSPTAFGVYALLLNAIIFLNTIQQSQIGYALCVRGAQAKEDRFRRLITTGLTATSILFLVNVLVLLAACLWIKRLPLLIPVSAALLLWQMQDTLRGAFISQLRQRDAVLGDALSYLGQAAVLAGLCRFVHLTVSGVFWVVASTSGAALALQLTELRPSWPGKIEMRAMLVDFWALGRWGVPARVMGFFTFQAFPWVIALRHGTAQVATFQALFLLVALANPVLLSMGNLITATIAKSSRRGPRDAKQYIVLTVLLTGSYLLLLCVAGTHALTLLYGPHSRYIAYGPELRTLAFAWMFEVVALVCTSILGGMERVKGLFWVQCTGCIGAVLIALPLVYSNGVALAGIGILLVNLIRAGCGIGLVLFALSGRWEPRGSRPGMMAALDEVRVTPG